MVEHMTAAFVVTLMLGMITWHTSRVLADGAIFRPVRTWFEDAGVCIAGGHPVSISWSRDGLVARCMRFLSCTLNCRLCLNTQVAFIFTWGLLVTALVVDRGLLPPAEWAFTFAVGPLLTAAWSEIVRRVEGIEV